jgi:hypothetical protein
MTATSGFSAFALEPFPGIEMGDDLAGVILDVLRATGTGLQDGDIVVVASKAVSVAEKRYVALADVTPSPQAADISARTGKPAAIVQLILDNSSDHFLATGKGPVIAWHTLGYQLTSAGIDRAGTGGAWLLPADPDSSARHLRDTLHPTPWVRGRHRLLARHAAAKTRNQSPHCARPAGPTGMRARPLRRCHLAQNCLSRPRTPHPAQGTSQASRDKTRDK